MIVVRTDLEVRYVLDGEEGEGGSRTINTHHVGITSVYIHLIDSHGRTGSPGYCGAAVNWGQGVSATA